MCSIMEMNNAKSPSKVSSTAVVVPWHNAAQFRKVYECLFSNELIKKRWAYDTIAIWEARCHPFLPTAIEATYALTGAVIQDILWNNKASLNHYNDVQSNYGAAITRFVSLTVGVNSSRNSVLKSCGMVAKSIGIPSFVVDIRNEFNHSGRPPLPLCRLAAKTALDYLKESYWDIEAARVKNYTKECKDVSNLGSVFKTYTTLYYMLLGPRQARNKRLFQAKNKLFQQTELLLSNMEYVLSKKKQVFITLMVSDYFIPSEDDIKLILGDERLRAYQDNGDMISDDEEEGGMTFDQFEEKYVPTVPKFHEIMWTPVISILNKYDAVPLFMETLLRSHGNRTVAGQKFVASWILAILRIHTACGAYEASRDLRDIFRGKGIVPDWRSMLYSALYNPCQFTPLFIPIILNKLNLKNNMSQVVSLLAVFLGAYKDKSEKKEQKSPKPYKIHTPEELKFVMHCQKIKKGELPLDSIWSEAPEEYSVSYDLWQLGAILNSVGDEKMEEDEDSVEKMDVHERLLPCNENDNDVDCDIEKPYVPDLKLMCGMMTGKKILYEK